MDTTSNQVVASDRSTLRVASFNIAHGRGLAESNWDGGGTEQRLERLNEIASLLRDLDADVVVLNEVDFDSSWSGSTNQASYLAQRAGYPYWAEQRNLDFRVLTWKWRFGNAVLSRYPISNAMRIGLPGYSSWESVLAGQKQGLVCELNIDTQTIRVAAVHLCHRSESVRAESAALISEIVRESRFPTIVAGDMNSTPADFPNSVSDPLGRNAIDVFDHSGLLQRSPTRLPKSESGNSYRVADSMTYHSSDPHSLIDWILIPRDWRFLEYRVEPTQLSDHRAVVADVTSPRMVASRASQ